MRGDEHLSLRTYGTIEHLVLKTFNTTLGAVEDIKRNEGADVIRVERSGNTVVGAFYMELSVGKGHRTMATIFDVVHRRSVSSRTALIRYTISKDIIVGCSCRNESSAESCVHTFQRPE